MSRSNNQSKLSDVAKLAGVSPSLVSLVINKSHGKNVRVSQETADRIASAAKSLNYVPNAAAKSLATKRSRCLGYVMSDAFVDPWKNEYYAGYLNGVAAACHEAGYGLLIGTCNLRNAIDFAIPEKIRQKSVDGLIVIGGIAPDLWEIYRRFELPTVLLDYTPETDEPPYAYIDFPRRWEHAALDYAIACGHRRIALCLGAYHRNYNTIYEDFAVHCRQLEHQTGARIHLLRPPAEYSNWEKELGGMLFEQWRSLPEAERPTMLIGGHSLPHYVKTIFQPAGVRIPADLSIVIGPDSIVCPYFSPPITAFDRNHDAQGRQAVRMLVAHLDHDAPLHNCRQSDDESLKLIERESVLKIINKGSKS